MQRNKPRTLVPGGGLAGNKAYLLRIGLYRLGWLFQRVKESGSVLRFPNPTLRKWCWKHKDFSQPALQFTSDWQKRPVTYHMVTFGDYRRDVAHPRLSRVHSKHGNKTWRADARMVVCRVAHRLSHSSPCHCVHPLGCLSRDDEIISHPSGIRLSVVVGSGIIIRFACPVSLQVLARYLTSQSALALTSLALSLSVGDQR